MIVIVQVYTPLHSRKPVSERYVVPGIGRYIKYRNKELVCFDMWLYFFILGGLGREDISCTGLKEGEINNT